jgi:hypothetical protein
LTEQGQFVPRHQPALETDGTGVGMAGAAGEQEGKAYSARHVAASSDNGDPVHAIEARLKLTQRHRGRAIAISAGSAAGHAPATFVICAIGGGAEGWSISHIGPDGRAEDLGGEYYFPTVEEALAFTRELIDLQLDAEAGPPPD